VTDDIPAEIQSWIGQIRYEEATEFDVERGYIWTTCASVENANPIFWDDAVARELTGGPIAPPTMLSVWFRPHYWAPGRTRVLQPLQIHFDLKEKLGLPEAVMTDNEIVFEEPVRPGDRLRTSQILHSISSPKTTNSSSRSPTAGSKPASRPKASIPTPSSSTSPWAAAKAFKLPRTSAATPPMKRP